MNIVLKLHASLTDFLPPGTRGNAISVEVADGATVADVLTRFAVPPQLVHLLLINGHYVAPALRSARQLGDGDHLALWPPVAGG
jgi:sulfur carrier protein ThiS